MATPLRTVPASAGDPLAEAIELTRRLKLPHIRRALPEVVPTAKAQRWDPAEVVRVLLAEEAA
ncbi:ATP-binding protein, partial [Microbispora sp. SCL1-1]